MAIKLDDILHGKAGISSGTKLKLSDFDDDDRKIIKDIAQDRITNKKDWFCKNDGKNMIIKTRIIKYDVEYYNMKKQGVIK